MAIENFSLKFFYQWSNLTALSHEEEIKVLSDTSTDALLTSYDLHQFISEAPKEA